MAGAVGGIPRMMCRRDSLADTRNSHPLHGEDVACSFCLWQAVATPITFPAISASHSRRPDVAGPAGESGPRLLQETGRLQRLNIKTA